MINDDVIPLLPCAVDFAGMQLGHHRNTKITS